MMTERADEPLQLPPPGGPIAVRITTLAVEVANPATPDVTERLEFIVDSGSVFSVVPTEVLRRLGIRPRRQQTFQLANNAHIVRWKGGALFKFREYEGVAEVIFGEEGDATLLGAHTLEAFGLGLDPIKRELRPMTLTL
jgi:predicted aspartyl protease